MQENQPRSIAIWLESLCSSRAIQSPAETEAREAKDRAILALLAKLSLHYWRPEFTPSQAKQMYADYVEDLREYALSDVSDAVKFYRRGGATFFPTSGQLVQIIRTIPSWDIRTPREHANLLHEAAGRELDGIVKKIEALQLPAPKE